MDENVAIREAAIRHCRLSLRWGESVPYEELAKGLPYAGMVAAYEDFLRQLVQSVLERRPLPGDRKAKVEIAFDLIAGDSKDGSLIHRLWAEQEAARVVGAGYAERPAEVRRALGIVPEELQDGRAPKFDLEQVKLACLMRNCIVHDGSRVDPRLKEALEKLGSAVPLGDPVPFTDGDLRRLFGELHAHAEALDLLARWEPRDKDRDPS